MSRPARSVDNARVTGLMFHHVHNVDNARVTGLVFHPAYSVTGLVSRLDHSIVNGRVTGLLFHLFTVKIQDFCVTLLTVKIMVG